MRQWFYFCSITDIKHCWSDAPSLPFLRAHFKHTACLLNHFQLLEQLLSGPGFLKSQLQSLNQFQTSLYQGRRTSKVFSSFFTLSPSPSGAFVFYSLHQGEEPLRHKCFWVTIYRSRGLTFLTKSETVTGNASQNPSESNAARF